MVVRGVRYVGSSVTAGVLLLAEAPCHRGWFRARLRGYVHRYLLNGRHQMRVAEYAAHARTHLEALGYVTQRSMEEIQRGYEAWRSLAEAESGLREASVPRGPIPIQWDASPELASSIYILCMLNRPATVIETGVARGRTSAAILSALQWFGGGRLYSVELPSLIPGYTQHVGELVGDDLRRSWSLRFGPSSHVLPELLDGLGSIDMFIHDSAHSYHPQKMEYELALAHLSPGGILMSDDVNNDAFIEVAESRPCRWAIIRQSKGRPIGILRTSTH